jgi:hypothetical protein
VTTLCPTPFKVVTIGSKNTFSPWLVPKRSMTSTQPASDRLAFSAELGGNTRNGDARRTQPRGFLIAHLPTCLGRLTAPVHSRGHRVRRHGGSHARYGQRFNDQFGGTADRGVLGVDNGTNGITKVA